MSGPFIESEETLTLVNEELKDRLTRQREIGTRVDAKGAGLVTILVASVPLGLWRDWSLHLLPSRISGLAAAFFAILSLSIRSYWNTPVPSVLVSKYASKSLVEVLGVLAGTRAEVFKRNALLYRRKVLYWRVSICLIGLAVTLAISGEAVRAWT